MRGSDADAPQSVEPDRANDRSARAADARLLLADVKFRVFWASSEAERARGGSPDKTLRRYYWKT
jgi:hypothetical protein